MKIKENAVNLKSDRRADEKYTVVSSQGLQYIFIQLLS